MWGVLMNYPINFVIKIAFNSWAAHDDLEIDFQTI